MEKLFVVSGVILAMMVGLAMPQLMGLTRQQIIDNQSGYQVERAPTYIIMTPRKVRPNQVFQVFATILRLEYSEISLRVSIIKGNTEFAESLMKFDQPGSRIMQMLMPANAQAGRYKIKVEGMLDGGAGGYAFYNETDIAFDAKQASVFIQLSKPIYRQGQSDLKPMYGSLTIYVNDPSGFPVRRWLGLQTNAGGFVSQNFTLSDQPNYGNWSIQVDAYFQGTIDFEFERQEILTKVREYFPGTLDLYGFECIFNVSARDWFFNMTQTGFASTVIFDPRVKLVFIGDNVAAMYHDGTPVKSDLRRIQIQKSYQGSQNTAPEEKMTVEGVAQFDIEIPPGMQSIEITATYDYDILTRKVMKATVYKSPSESYISVRTSTEHPKVNEFMIFHIVAQGNILIGDELEMISRHKTFAVALSPEMVPTARIVVYFLQTSPEEMVVDTLNFFVNGTRNNPVNAVINKGKDFTLHTLEINAIAEPGSYVAFAAMPNDLYSKGMNDGLTENNFYASSGYGVDANSTFRHAGLLVMSDANLYTVEGTKEDPRYVDDRTMNMIYRVSRSLRFYEDSGWAWQEKFVKPDGMVQFRVEPPKFPLTWIINALSVLLTMKDGGDKYRYVWVNDMGITSAYAPRTESGDHQTILEPGESKDIFLPIVSTIVQGEFTFTVTAQCFMERDIYTKTIKVLADGVLNYYHTPYLIDMIRYGSETIPHLQIVIPDQFVVPEVRYHLYVPGSGIAEVSLFGDVVTPGFFKLYMNCEDIFRKPYGAGEMNMFNFAYNLLTLKFKKTNQQLPPDVLSTALRYLNVDDGSFKMFRDDENSTSVWLSAFVAKTLHEARFGEWERDLFIPINLIDKIVVWLCSKQNETGAWYPEDQIYDRKFSTIAGSNNLLGHQVPLTAYVLIALYKIKTDVSGAALSCIDKSRTLAAEFLSRESYNIPNEEIFHLAITSYALSLSQQKSRSIFDKLWSLQMKSNEIYFSDSAIPDNPSEFINALRYLLPRIEQMNDGYAVQSTAYALMAHIKHNGMGVETDTKIQRDAMMRWLNYMRNFVGGMASTQDTLVAMEALSEFTQVDPNRNVFNILVSMEASSTPTWHSYFEMTKTNYTEMQHSYIPQDFTYGTIGVSAQGVGRTMMQLTTTVHVEYPWLLKKTQDEIQFFELTAENTRWVYTDKSMESGLTVLEVDIPTGFVIMNHTLRDYVRSRQVPNLKRAEFYYNKVVFYFSHVDTTRTCVKFRADRMHNTSIYTTYNNFNLNICYVCGSYQCPYCPYFNSASLIKASLSLLALIIGFFVKRYVLRTT
ncbi:CPMD8-like protein [Mya arenaria]|uniref:CPMD8-like protein n=1 Tax=Mya arenaria TaxID=6604 RepID=A0ABY7EUF6_MYAAR|nr:CPMD8-like protein [Mya arenaria]